MKRTAASGMAALGLTAVVGLWAGQAGAVSLIESAVTTESAESGGDDPGSDLDGDQSAVAGAAVSSATFRCPGTATCAFLPGDQHGAHANAETSYGTNRASIFAESGRDFANEIDVYDSAQASSMYIDDWTFQVAPSAVGKKVSLEFHLDGSWLNGASVEFEASVFDLSLPEPPPGIEDPPLFLPVNAQAIAGMQFRNDQSFAIGYPPVVFIPVPDGGQEDGSIDLTVLVEFVPTSGNTYAIASRLFLRGSDSDGTRHDITAHFGSTAELTQVILPNGISFESATGANWNVVVPEPTFHHWLGIAAAGVTLARRREAA